MSNLSRYLTVGVAISALALVGCSSQASVSTSPSPTVSSAATSPTSVTPSASAVPTPTATVPAGVTASLNAMAAKLGCVDKSVVPPSDTLKKVGVTGGLECLTKTDHFVIITTEQASQVPAAAKSLADGLQNPGLPYLTKDNWLVVGSTTASPTMTKEVAQVAQAKLGGTIAAAG